MNNFVYESTNKNEITITKYTGNDKNVIIPSKINGLPICRIGYCAFRDCINLTSVTIPDSVTSIGSNAFYDCSSLTSVTLPDSVTSIGGLAFWGCSNLTSITIPNSVTSIGNSTFYNCSSLTTVTIPDSVTSIGEYAFWCCSNLTLITIPDSVTQIDWNAFENCPNLKTIKCNPGSYAEQWANEHGFETTPIMSKLQQLLNQTNPPITEVNHLNFTNERSDHNEI